MPSSPVFRGKYLQALHKAEQDGRLTNAPQADRLARAERRARLLRHDWVVYAKTARHGAAAVLDYLARYTHRVAVSDERIVGIKGKAVLRRVRADTSGGKRCVRIDGLSFIGRFLTHVLPAGFKRIRHYGWLGPAHKRERLAQARAALAMPTPYPLALEQADAFMRRVAKLDINTGPHCGLGHWRSVQVQPALTARGRETPVAMARAPP
ncbi:MAG: IS91 family transposase [Chromatiales bacterium]